MPLIILHDLEGGEVAINSDVITAAKRRVPDEHSHIESPFTKLYYASKSSDGVGFPDTVRETPAEIVALSRG